MRRIYWGSGILAALVAALLIIRLDRCWWIMAISEWLEAHFQSSPPASTLRITFLGASTLLVEDGDRAIMIDGFFTRPMLGFPISATSVTPSGTAVDNALEALQVSTPTQPRALNLAAVIVNHSHYDHAMDAPMVAEKTGALLVGSNSTANVGRSRGLPEDRLRIFGEGPTGYCFRPFRLTVLRTGHVPIGTGTPFAGQITTTSVPQTVGEYKEGGTFAILIRRHGKTVLVQGSAGFAAGALANRPADVVFLAVGGLSLAGQNHRDAYWNEVVGNVAPRRIFPIHWDDLSGALDANLGPSFDGNAGISDVTMRAQAVNIDVRVPVAFEKFDPFEGL